jgi:uncharacterized Zn-binding protein involved in type VI secretion
MPALSRKGDKNSVGGQLMRGSSTVICDGKPVALHVSKVTPHSPWQKKRHPPHQSSVTVDGSSTVICDGVPVVRVGSQTSCGHKIVQGSGTVQVP